jgi:hypothetical protein
MMMRVYRDLLRGQALRRDIEESWEAKRGLRVNEEQIR